MKATMTSAQQETSEFVYTGKQELDDMQIMQNYNRGIVSILKGCLENGQKIVDFGAGIGTLASFFPQSNITCLEIDKQQQAILKQKGFHVVESLEGIADASITFFYSSNVLEHIEDDYTTVQEIWQKIAPQGRVVFYVPAFPVLFSEMDRRVGHFRRYTKKRLTDVFSQANFDIEKIFYSDSLGFLATLVFKFIGSKEGIASRKQLLFYDRIVYPVSRFLDTLFFSRYLGKNIVLVARKT
jgi:SAM-dependent methyltransferase